MLQAAVNEPLSGVQVTVTGGAADVRQNFVTDGANLFVAVSRYDRGTQPVAVTVGVEPRVQARLSRVGTYPGLPPFPLGGLQTRFLRVALQLLPSDAGDVANGVPMVARRFEQVIGVLEQERFEPTAILGARDLVRRARELLASYPSRSIAALAALSRMVFVRAEYGEGRVRVSARYPWLEAAGNPPGSGIPAVTPLSGGRVQVLYLENAQEEFDAPATDARGMVSFALPPPREARWDFDVSDFRIPDPRQLHVIEVHVFDSRTGATGFAVVDPRQVPA